MTFHIIILHISRYCFVELRHQKSWNNTIGITLFYELTRVSFPYVQSGCRLEPAIQFVNNIAGILLFAINKDIFLREKRVWCWKSSITVILPVMTTLKRTTFRLPLYDFSHSEVLHSYVCEPWRCTLIWVNPD